MDEVQIPAPKGELGDEVRAALVELARRKAEEPIRYFVPNKGAQREFFELMKVKREVAYFAGNKSGKCVSADTLISGQRIDSFGFEKGSARLWDLCGRLRVASGHRVLTPTGWHFVSTQRESPSDNRFVALLQAPALSSGDISLSDFLLGDSHLWQTVSSFQSDYLAYFRSHGGQPQPLSVDGQDGLPLQVGASAYTFADRYAQEHNHLYQCESPLSIDHALHPVHQSFSVPDLETLPPAEQSLPNILVFDLSELPVDLKTKVLLGADGLDLASSLVYVVMWSNKKIYSILFPVNVVPVEGEAEESYWDTSIPFTHAYEAGGFINHNTHVGAKYVVQAALANEAVGYGMEAIYDEPIDVWIGSVDYRIQRESAQREIEFFLPKREIKKMYTLQNGIIDRIELENGSTIGFKTYEQGRKAWQGPKRHIVWFDEEPPEEIIKEGMARLIQRNAKLIFTMTPLMGHTIVYQRFIEDNVPYRGYVFGTTYENSAHLDTAYIKTMEDMSDDDRAQRLMGQFMRLEGLVFQEFSRKNNVIPHIEPEKEKYTFLAGFDFGADHPTAFCIAGVDAWENIYVFREYKQSNATLEDHAKAFKLGVGGYECTKSYGDPSAKQWMKEMRSFRDKSLRLAITHGINDRPSGIALINSLFKKNKLFISDNCPQLIYELLHHRYKTKKEGQRDGDVVKSDDDIIDSLRYLMSSAVRAKLHSGFQTDWKLKPNRVAEEVIGW
jgi:PBSX family phage terminase large subunit